jgi:arylsulfatase A-like enzyme
MRPQLQRLRPNTQAKGDDENVVEDAIEFLRIHGKTSRWLLYLHLMDLHEYTYDEESALFGNDIGDLYDNSVLRTDWIVSTLYDYLVEEGLDQKTIIVLLSDHGEAFGERGFEGHARAVFPETTETPLIISLPFALREGIVVEEVTTNNDVWPTLIELVGLEDDREKDGRSRIDAILAAGRGEPPATTAEEFSTAFIDENWGRPGSGLMPSVSVVEGDFRYVAGTGVGGRRFEVLLTTEDGQVANRMDDYPEVADRLREQAQREIEAKAIFPPKIYELDQMQLDQLRALGYEIP